MLVLSRKANQSIIIGETIKLTVLETRGKHVRLGIEAPPEVSVMRGELVGEAQTAADPEAKAGRLRILIVDDDEVDRRQIRRLLSKNETQKYAIHEIDRGREGLQSCRSNPPDCVILDYCLPDIDGLEFLSSLRENENGVHIPVLLISGQKGKSIGQQSLDQGAQGFLIKKDMSHRTLYSAINNAIRYCSSN